MSVRPDVGRGGGGRDAEGETYRLRGGFGYCFRVKGKPMQSVKQLFVGSLSNEKNPCEEWESGSSKMAWRRENSWSPTEFCIQPSLPPSSAAGRKWKMP